MLDRVSNTNRVMGDPPPGMRVTFEAGAENCVLRVGRNVQMTGLVQFRGPGAEITIGENARLRTHILIGTGSISIGEGTYIGPNSEVSTAEGANLTIGARCLIGAFNIIRSDDGHPFYDRGTGRRLNRSRDTTIADHVWSGRNAAFLPGATVEEGSIIGAMTVVTASRRIPPHSLAVGNPARVIRSNVSWLYKHVQLNLDEIPETIPITPEPHRESWLRAVTRRVHRPARSS